MISIVFLLSVLALDPPFCDHAVLQRDKPVVVRGSADAGAAVAVSFAGKTVKGVADAAGRWSVKLPAMPASKEPRDLTVVAQSNNRTIQNRTIHDILVGEVWLASGQSNMEMPLWHPTRKRFRDKMGGLMRQFPPPANLRVMMTWPERGVSATPRRDYPVAWTVPDEAWLSTNKFSACAYYFGRELLTTLDVPVGVIAAFWGGTQIGYWVPDSGWASVKGEPHVATKILERVAKRVALESENKRRGWPGYPGDLWNEQVAVFAPYTVRGMIWYQGESNIDQNFFGRLAYSKNMRALMDGWRREFECPDMKLLFVELAQFSYPWLKLTENDERLARLCDEQQRFEREEPDAHLACISDVGDVNDIHPCRKWEVGTRLAALAFQHVYGLPVRADPPRAVSARLVAPGKVEISLANAQGLYRWMPEVSLWTTNQHEVSPIRFIGRDGRIVDCESTITNGMIVAESAQMKDPAEVAYLRRCTDESNIYNDSTLPLGTFRLKVEGGSSDAPRVAALCTKSWDASEWISVTASQIADEASKKRQRAADGTSCFWRRVVNGRSIRSAKWMTTGLGVYNLFVNGHPVGEDFLKPGFTHFAKTRRSFTYDVTQVLRRGVGESNDFGAEVSSGWWRDKCGGYAGKKSAFRCVIELTYVDGTTELVGTKANEWFGEVAGSVKHAGIFDGEEYDARQTSCSRKPRVGFVSGGCERNDEFAGEILPSVGAEVCLRRDLAMRRGPFSVLPGETLVVDFGQNCAAVPHFVFRAKRGTVLTALPGEMLNDAGKGERGCDGPQGSVYRANLRIPNDGMRVVYTFADENEVDYMPTFTYFGYRYLAIAATDKVEIESVTSVPVTSVAREMETGSLKTGVPDLNTFISNVYWGQISNYLSVPTDCPQRNERRGWLADTQVFAEAGAYNADTCGFLRKWMRDVRDSADDQGGFPSAAPWAHYGDDYWKFGWADASVIVPWTAWKMFGDREIVEENFAAMARFVRRLDETKYDLEPGVGYNFADWLSYEKFETCGNSFGGWGKWEKDPDAMNYRRYLAACYWLYDARLMVQMAEALGRFEEAVWFRGSADRALAHIRGKFLESDGLLLKPMRDLQTACVFALHFGIVEGRAKDATLALLKKNIRDHGDCLQTGFLGTSFLMDALSDCGETELCYTLLLQHRNPSWLYSVDQGATTVWERWNSYTKDKGFGPVGMNSFNHYAYGQVLGWMYRNIAGIAADPANPGFRKIIMKPRPDRRIGSAKASYRSRAGLIRSEWKYEGDKWVWDFTVPVGATASVTLPGEKTARSYRAGSHHIESAEESLSFEKRRTTK